MSHTVAAVFKYLSHAIKIKQLCDNALIRLLHCQRTRRSGEWLYEYLFRLDDIDRYFCVYLDAQDDCIAHRAALQAHNEYVPGPWSGIHVGARFRGGRIVACDYDKGQIKVQWP